LSARSRMVDSRSEPSRWTCRSVLGSFSMISRGTWRVGIRKYTTKICLPARTEGDDASSFPTLSGDLERRGFGVLWIEAQRFVLVLAGIAHAAARELDLCVDDVHRRLVLVRCGARERALELEDRRLVAPGRYERARVRGVCPRALHVDEDR